MSSPLILMLSTLTLVLGQQVDQETLMDIFGTPPPIPDRGGPTTPRLEDITVRPTDSNSVFQDANGNECQCVPYYLCDADLNGVYTNNNSITGWGSLDVRIGERKHDCQESIERCCTSVKQTPEQPSSESPNNGQNQPNNGQNPPNNGQNPPNNGQNPPNNGQNPPNNGQNQPNNGQNPPNNGQNPPNNGQNPPNNGQNPPNNGQNQPNNGQNNGGTDPGDGPLPGCGHINPGGLDFVLSGGSGSEAGFGEYPWVVALLNADNNGYVGVGVLVHPSVVVTGAHVVKSYRSNGWVTSLKARAGEWDTQTSKERLRHQERIVEEVYIHHAYNEKNLYNDIALLRLNEPVNLDRHINVICLPEQGESFDTARGCVANGWGKDVFGKPGRYAVILKKIQVDMVPHGLCSQQLKQTRLGGRFRLHDSFLCAGGEEGKDTCQGDGGAPLACQTRGRHTLTGLVAWGIGCGTRGVPAVYTNVPAFRQWIDDKMQEWQLV